MQMIKIFVLIGAISLCAIPSQAQVGTPKWYFHDRVEVEEAARKYKMNLRESYNIIMCAKRQGMIRSVVRTYERDLSASPFDTPPEVCSSFALAHDLMTSSVRWDWKPDYQRGLTKLTQGDGVRITFYRDRALELLPKSPEALLASAITALNQDKRAESLNLINKALRSAPNWAELHWWRAKALDYRLIAMGSQERQKEKARYSTLILRALSESERLDSAFKQENLLRRSETYSNLGRYKDALQAFDAYILYKPKYRQFIGEAAYLATRKQWTEQAQKTGQL
jgi:tetratricopeptide (TPR) repeat protein